MKTYKIDMYAPRTGRTIGEDGTTLNIADTLASINKLLTKKVQEVQFHNGVAIRDTLNNDVVPGNNFDVSVLTGRKVLLIYNTLNQPVTITLLAKNKAGSSINAGTKTIPAVTYGVITASDIPALADALQGFNIRAACTTAPTAGSLTIQLEGVA